MNISCIRLLSSKFTIAAATAGDVRRLVLGEGVRVQ
jgi:hypothetical protein